MADDLLVLILAGTTRVQRESIHAARFVAKIGEEIEGIKIHFVDPVDFNFPGDGNDPEGKDPRYSELTKMADAFFIISPEYNHSFPGSLKRMLDSELKNYIHKPVALAGASNGNWGGVRAVEALVNTVREMGLVVTFTDVYFPKVDKLFDDNANYLGEFHKESVRKAYDELIWMAKALKVARNSST